MSEQLEASAASLASVTSYQEGTWVATPHHPWRRAFATFYDVTIFGMLGMALIGTMLGIFTPAAEHGLNALADSPLGKFVWYFLSGIIAVPIMAFFLSEFGTTPGKWIWGIRLDVKNGAPREFFLMLKRELMMFFLGYAANLGPATLGTGLLARSTLLKTGQTQWDATYSTLTLYRENSTQRIVIGVSVLMCLLVVISALPASQ